MAANHSKRSSDPFQSTFCLDLLHSFSFDSWGQEWLGRREEREMLFNHESYTTWTYMGWHIGIPNPWTMGVHKKIWTKSTIYYVPHIHSMGNSHLKIHISQIFTMDKLSQHWGPPHATEEAECTLCWLVRLCAPALCVCICDKERQRAQS